MSEELTNSIRVERAKRNMTQQDLATLIRVSRKTINTIETGRFVPSTVLALKLAQAFGVRVEELFSLQETSAP